LLVNYPRRYSAQSQRAKKLIESGEIGGLRSGHVWYGKGVANSGSHLINLLIYLFGDGWSVDRVEVSETANLSDDFDATFRMSRGGSSIMFTPLDVSTFEFAEIDLIFESGRLRFVDHAHSLVEQVGTVSAGFEGMSQLVGEKLLPEDSVREYQLNVLNFVVERVKDGTGFDSEVSDAVSTAEIVEMVQRAISGRDVDA
jgi:predicted dehydrogenase